MRAIALIFVSFTSVALADFKKVETADVIYKSELLTYTVKADGSYTLEEDIVLAPQSEKGRIELGLEEIRYEPDLETITITHAETKTDGEITPVPFDSIVEQTPKSDQPGLTDQKT